MNLSGIVTMILRRLGWRLFTSGLDRVAGDDSPEGKRARRQARQNARKLRTAARITRRLTK